MTDNASIDKELLFKILENLARTDERVKALVEANKDAHTVLKESITNINTVNKELCDRVDALEKEGVKLSLFWKLLLILGPIGATTLITILLKIFGV